MAKAPTDVPSYVHGASEIPLLGETIGRNLDRTVARVPDRDALVSVHQGIRLTYAQFLDAVEEYTQKLHEMHAESGYNPAASLSISGALVLYLDFINLFISLLRLFGSRR